MKTMSAIEVEEVAGGTAIYAITGPIIFTAIKVAASLLSGDEASED